MKISSKIWSKNPVKNPKPNFVLNPLELTDDILHISQESSYDYSKQNVWHHLFDPDTHFTAKNIPLHILPQKPDPNQKSHKNYIQLKDFLDSGNNRANRVMIDSGNKGSNRVMIDSGNKGVMTGFNLCNFSSISSDFSLKNIGLSPTKNNDSVLDCKIFWEQTFASFLEWNFGLEFAEPVEIWRIRQITAEICRIPQICPATVRIKLNCNFWKFAIKVFLKNDIRYQSYRVRGYRYPESIEEV